jgi:hypothetical protein
MLVLCVLNAQNTHGSVCAYVFITKHTAALVPAVGPSFKYMCNAVNVL